MGKFPGGARISSATLGLIFANAAFGATSSGDDDIPNLIVGQSSRNLVVAHDFVAPRHSDQIHIYLDSPSELDDLGKLRKFNASGNVIWKNKIADSGNDGSIAWGRWALGVIAGNGDHSQIEISGGEGARNSLYYAIGDLAGDAALEAAAAEELVASFSLLGGGVAPTAGEGGGASITYINEAGMQAQFGEGRVDANLDITVPSGNYIVTMKGLKLQGDGFALDAETTVESTGTLCVAGCTATIVGFFAGENLARSAIAYNIVNNALSRDINGVITFTRD